MSLPTRLFKLDTPAVRYAYKNPDAVDLAKDPLGRLINTAKKRPNALKSSNYCAVTFVWGKDPPTIDVVNISWKVPIAKDKLLFFLEACTRRGYEYVWMDILCVDQGSNGDKQVEIPKMKEYYTNAHATIVFGENWNGFASSWKKVEVRISEWNGDWKKTIDPDWSGFQDIDDLIQDKWFWRVWTLQEAVIPLTTRPFDTQPVPYTPARLLTSDGAMFDIRGLCDLVEWTYIALAKLPLGQSSYPWIHPGAGVVNDRGWWRGYLTTSRPSDDAYAVQGCLDGIDKLRGLYALIDSDWHSLKDNIDDACKEIAEEYIEREEGALLLAMAVTQKNDLTWAAGAFRNEFSKFGSCVPDSGCYPLKSATIINKTTLKLTVANASQITIHGNSYGDGSGQLIQLINDLINMQSTYNFSPIVTLLKLAIHNSQIVLNAPINDINDIKEVVGASISNANAVSSALRLIFSGWDRWIITVNGTALLAWLPNATVAMCSLLRLSSGVDEWAVIVEGDTTTGRRKVGIAFARGLQPVGSQTDVYML